MVIDACRPYERLDTFPKVCESSPELAAKVAARDPELFHDGKRIMFSAAYRVVPMITVLSAPP